MTLFRDCVLRRSRGSNQTMKYVVNETWKELGNASQSHDDNYPRVFRARRRVEKMEATLQDQMLKNFDGLTADQRTAILQLISRNSAIRHRVKGRPPSPLPEEFTAKTFTVITDDDEMNSLHLAPSITEFHIEDNPSRVGKDKGEADGDGDKRKSKAVRPRERDGKDEPIPALSISAKTAMDPREKYALFIDKDNKARDKAVANAEENSSLQEMKKVTYSLHRWVNDVLDSPVVLHDPMGEQEGRRLPSAGEATDDKMLSGAGTLNPALQGEASTANGDFDILLNAWKPSILETKPPIRLSVVQERNPPEALIQSLKENLSNQIGDALFEHANDLKHRRRMLREQQKSQSSETTHKAKYGAWYVKPELWDDFMRKDSGTKKPESEARVGGIVQRKLDEIMAHRAKDDAIHSQLAVPATTNGATATSVGPLGSVTLSAGFEQV